MAGFYLYSSIPEMLPGNSAGSLPVLTLVSAREQVADVSS